jgi:hypothetical protein
MDEAIAWLIGVVVVVAAIIYAIVWLVTMALAILYTTLVWTANAILAGLDVMLSFGTAAPAWVGWAVWGIVLGCAVGYASSSAAAQHRRAVIIAPLIVLLFIAVVRNLV